MTATFYWRHGLASGAKTYVSSTTETLRSKDSNRQVSELEPQRTVIETKTIELKTGANKAIAGRD
jgi:hypothetical protein